MYLRGYLTALATLKPLIEQIRVCSGIPGLSIGVLHEGEVIEYTNFGFRDVSARIPPDENTIYVVASLSKAFTSAMTGILVDQGEIHWDTRVRDILPGYQRDKIDSAYNATLSDMLCHRSGVLGPDRYWMLSDGKVAFPRDDFVRVFNSLPTVQPARTAFIYNNYAYELLGQVVEKVSNRTIGNLLKERIMDPLGMNRTFDTKIPPGTQNVAKPYASLLNRTVYELGMPLLRQDGLFSAAGGIRTSVSDLLKFYNALMDAGMSQLEGADQRIPENPLKGLRQIWKGMISLPFPSLREHSYALGWTRAQLPSTFGLDGPAPWKAIVGKENPCRLAIYHQGIIQGYTSFSVLIPETRSAIVVLANAGGLNEAGMLIAAAILDTLFGTKIDEKAYRRLAEMGYEAAASRQSHILKDLEAGREIDIPIRPLKAYTGRYYNSLRNFFIDIRVDGRDGLLISFMGGQADSFPLVPYRNDKFYWHLTHDECVSRGRLTEPDSGHYIISFIFSGKEDAVKLYWKYDPEYPGDGEEFKRAFSFGYRQVSREISHTRDNFQIGLGLFCVCFCLWYIKYLIRTWNSTFSNTQFFQDKEWMLKRGVSGYEAL